MIPVLWSFRRCPYAMRARLAIAVSGQQVALREVLLRDKAQAFLDTSSSATVPCLDTGTEVIDESLDIMLWALRRNDPENWLDVPAEGFDLIETGDGPFKTALDRYKYHSRIADAAPKVERDNGMAFLNSLAPRLENGCLFNHPGLADFAILPFVRQFAFVDKPRFDTTADPRVAAWLAAFLSSDRFHLVMPKFPIWSPGDDVIDFPGATPDAP